MDITSANVHDFIIIRNSLRNHARLTGNTWHRFEGSNLQALYGFGTLQQADAYCEYLNKERPYNQYYVGLLTFDAAAKLMMQCGEMPECDLTTLLDCIADADGEEIQGRDL